MSLFLGDKAKKYVVLAVVVVPCLFIAWCYFQSFSWVMLSGPQEVFSEKNYDWPVEVIVTSWVFLVCCLFLIVSCVGVFFKSKFFGCMIFSCIFLFGLIEILESVLMHLKYGTNFFDFGEYAYGPALILWSFLILFMLRMGRRVGIL